MDKDTNCQICAKYGATIPGKERDLGDWLSQNNLCDDHYGSLLEALRVARDIHVCEDPGTQWDMSWSRLIMSQPTKP